MIKAIIFDTDGVVLKREMYFSDRFCRDYGLTKDTVMPFFIKEFKDCLVGKADLKEELDKYLLSWNWDKTVQDFMDYWFESESNMNIKLLDRISELKKQGIICLLATNNEKYRVDYISKALELDKIFDQIYSSAAIGYAKPTKEFWEYIYKDLKKFAKKEILVIDDEEKNVVSAEQFGFDAKLYSNSESLVV